MGIFEILPGNIVVYVTIAHLLFGLGLFGILFRKTLIGLLISLELLLQGVGVNLMAFGTFLGHDHIAAKVITLFVLGIAASEAALFLGIAVAVFRNYQTVATDKLNQLKG